MSQRKVKLIECPRDAMQGITDFIPTEVKVNYINKLLKVGFDTLDVGSFVSLKAIPQLKDTAEVLNKIDASDTKLLTIIANERGAKDAVEFEQVDYLGYPFSVSETFQQRNTNASIDKSLSRVEAIQNLAQKNQKKVVLYLSMGFGNPYGDPYHEDIVANWVEKLSELEIGIFALSDTIGIAKPPIIENLFSTLIQEHPGLEFGAHFHTTAETWKEKVEAAFLNGCHRFDGAIAGFGGCPMATDELTGNMPTENLIAYFNDKALELALDQKAFEEASREAAVVF